MRRRTLALRAFVFLASAIATAAVLAGQQTVVATRDGEIRGERLNEDTFSIQILDASGVIHVVDKVTREVRSLTMRGVSCRSPGQGEPGAAQLADVLGRLPGHATTRR